MKFNCIVVNCIITSKIDGDSVKMDNDIVQMMAFSLSIWHASYICLKCSNMPYSHVANMLKMLNISNMPNVWTRLFSTNVFCSWFYYYFSSTAYVPLGCFVRKEYYLNNKRKNCSASTPHNDDLNCCFNSFVRYKRIFFLILQDGKSTRFGYLSVFFLCPIFHCFWNKKTKKF